MNILILTTHLNPGGISRYVINLAKGLSCSHRVWVACWGGSWRNKLSLYRVSFKYIPIHTKSMISIKVFFSLIILFPFIIKHKIDIIHANTRVTQFLAFLLYKMLGINYISSFHGFYRRHIFRRLFKFEGIRAIAVSQAVRGHLENDLGIDKDRIKVIYNGIDVTDHEAEGCKKSEFSFKENDILLGILGRISAEKGHFLAVDAFNILKDKYKNAYLVISGEGRLKRKLRDYIEKLNLSDRVKFLNLEGERFLDLVDILLVASSKEGFGYIILEAFLRGICVIGFATGAIPELITDHENGILFYKYEPSFLEEVTEELINNDALRQRITYRAKEKLKDFSLDAMVKKTESLYREVVSL